MTERYEDDFEDLEEKQNPFHKDALRRLRKKGETVLYVGKEEEKPEVLARRAQQQKKSGKMTERYEDDFEDDIEEAAKYRKGKAGERFNLNTEPSDDTDPSYDVPSNRPFKDQIDPLAARAKRKMRVPELKASMRATTGTKKGRPIGQLPEEASSSAAETLSPNSKPTNLDSKTGLMAAAMAAIGGMSKEDLSHFLNDALAQIGQEAANIDGGAAAKNAATIQMKPSAAGSAVKEDLDELFGDDLSEEFKDQASTLFEAAVQARIIVETAALEEAYEEALNEEIEEVTSALVEKVDDYLTYVAEQWVAENEVAIESALKVEVMEDFVNGLKDLFVENYIEIPSGKTDVLEDLVLTVESLEEKLNSVLSENIELKKELNEKVIDDTFETVAEGLAATQIEKLRTLSEGVDYNSVEDYKKKLTLIRGKLVENKRVSTNIITEEAPAYSSEYEDAPKSGFIDSDVRNYVSAISRTVKK